MSALNDALTDYLATRRALGAKFRSPESFLRRFVAFLESEGAEFLTVDLALRWVATPVKAKPSTRTCYLGLVRGFAVWLHATDPRTQIPPPNLLRSGQRRPTPYIYSSEEIASLMAAAHGLRSPTTLRCWTYATLVGLLAASGLRSGEALALDESDVDLSKGFLSIRKSKFGKCRLVPLKASTRAALAHYVRRRDEIRPERPTAAFLVAERGARLRSSAAQRTFAILCQATGLRARSASRRVGHGPRLQDLRHTFATRRLVEWYRAGCNVEQLMPALSTYLGHSRVQDTYWYIQAVPELLQLATERLQALGSGGTR